MITRHLARRVADGVLGVLAATPPQRSADLPAASYVSSAVKVIETLHLDDGTPMNRTFYVAATALSFTPLSQAAFLTGGNGVKVPAMPDPPLDADASVGSITYHQRDAGFERTTVYRREPLDSVESWSAWQLVSDHLEWHPPGGARSTA